MTGSSPHHGHGQQSLLLRALPTSLPRVEVWQVRPAEPDPRSLGDGRDSERFGYNDDAEWKQDMHYTRWVQPLENELAKQVEYDMDENDREWMDEYNAERHADGLERISYEFFEILMDKLEKDWFDLQKYIPKPTSSLPAEDSKCAICDDGECEASNAIVFCDGCNLAVHQDCYGVPYIPEGQWLCRKCTVSPDRPVSCALCPADFGAFKQTTNGKWAHLLCAIWINETGVSNTVYMEPVDGLEAIPKGRWKLVCYLCKKKVGACIQCSKGNCYLAYHVTCARDYGLYLRLGTSSGMATADGSPGANVSYCSKHSVNMPINGDEREASEDSIIGTPGAHPPLSAARRQPPKKLQRYSERHPSEALETPGTTVDPAFLLQPLHHSAKQNRAYNKSFASAGPPVIPHFIFEKIWDYVKPIRCRQKNVFVKLVCRYWSLKRESRRGAPLLKRLHLEPWTASGGSRQATDLEKEKKLELILLLRRDLEKVRTLTELVRKREKEKLRRIQLIKTVVEQIVFPQTAMFKTALKQIILLDKGSLFVDAVNPQEVPDYYDVIQKPMWWNKIASNLDDNLYLTAAELQSDVGLVLINALRYNKPEDRHGKAALKLQALVQPILWELNSLDERGSLTHRLHEELLHLFDEQIVHRMMSMWYPKPAPEMPPAQLPEADPTTSQVQENQEAPAAPNGDFQPDMHPLLSEFTPVELPNPAAALQQHSPLAAPATEERLEQTGLNQGILMDSALTYATQEAVPELTADQPVLQLASIAVTTSLSDTQKPSKSKKKRTISGMEDGENEEVLQASRVPTRATRSAAIAPIETPLPESLGRRLPELQETDGQSSAARVSTRTTRSTSPVKVPEESELPRRKRTRSEELEKKRVDERERKARLRAKRARASDAAGPPTIPIPEIREDTAEAGESSFAANQASNDSSMEIDRNDVTNHDSFLLFNVGWVLPEGSRRRARSAFSAGPSTLGVQQRGTRQPGTSISPMAQTAPLPSIPMPQQSPEAKAASLSAAALPSPPEVDMLDSELSDIEDSQKHPPKNNSKSAPMPKKEVKPSSTASDLSELSEIEELLEDIPSGPTPGKENKPDHRRSSASATPVSTLRPAKTRRMLAAEAALFGEASETAPESGEPLTQAVQVASPLASVSNLPEERGTASRNKQSSASPSKPASSSTKAHTNVDVPEHKPNAPLTGKAGLARVAELVPLVSFKSAVEVENYELVWARARPLDAYWPAEACTDFEDEDRDIPQGVLDSMPDGVVGAKQKRGYKPPPDEEREVLVEYFAHIRTWGYIRLGNLCKLRENAELDALLQTRAGQPGKAKGKRDPAVLAKAYQAAIAVAEIPEDLEN